MIVATAGHVDHGKTTLVRALTGVDTDRLPEEKKRGLSIDLGFAYLSHPDDGERRIGFIDVPGHEKFVRNMIAGVGAVDVALLIVAADDGVMPQTREHLAILQLLGVDRLIVVISKADLVSAQAVSEVQQSLRALLDSSGFGAQDATRYFSVSVEQPATVEQLRGYLFELASQREESASAGYFRLAVDRSFTVTGAGTVVTGTVMSGSVAVEDSLRILSSGAEVRVRGLRAQNVEATRATAGQRCALNITGGGLRQSLPRRGEWLVANPALQLTTLIDVSLQSVTDAGSSARSEHFRHWTPGHLHLATASTTCRVALLQQESLSPGASGFARIYCDKPLAAVAGDRFVLRDQAARTTIAGGTVIDPLPPSRGRSRDDRLRLLQAMHQPDATTALSRTLADCRTGVDLNGFIARYNMTREDLQAQCERLSVVSCESAEGWWGVANSHWAAVEDTLLETLEQWHQDHPLLLGASVDQLQKQMRPLTSELVVRQALDSMLDDNRLQRKGAIYRCSGWSARLDDKHEAYWETVLSQMQASGHTAPRVVELAELLSESPDDVIKSLNLFVAHGRLYRVSANRYYTPTTLLQLAQIAERLAVKGEFTVAAYRDESGIGRNLVIELLEFFDRQQFTRRMGQHRVVLQAAEVVFD